MIIKSIKILVILLFFIVNINCKSEGSVNQEASNVRMNKVKKVSEKDKMGVGKDTEIIKMKMYRYIDNEGFGEEAFSFLVPIDWKVWGGINWSIENPGMPAVVKLKVSNPKVLQEFEIFPNQAFFWTNNQLVLATFPIGSKYYGAEVHPIMTASDAITKVVLPRFRNNATGLTLSKIEQVPELAKVIYNAHANQPGVQYNIDTAKTHINYTLNNIAIEEELYAVVEAFTFQFQSMQGIISNTLWTVDYIFSFKAEKGKLNQAAKTLQMIAYSFKLNTRWYYKYVKLIEYLAQQEIKRIHSIGQISKMISKTYNEISDMQMESYYKEQAIRDKIAENWSDYIRGVDRYYNPLEGKEVELPAGYNSVWTNNSGEYILTDSTLYNPNEESNKNWVLIEKQGK